MWGTATKSELTRVKMSLKGESSQSQTQIENRF